MSRPTVAHGRTPRRTAVPGLTAAPGLAAALAVLAVLAGFATLLAGCGTGPTERAARSATPQTVTSGPTGAPTSGAGADADPSGNLRLLAEHGPAPLDAWSWTPTEAGTVARAVDELTARCMAENGFPAGSRDAEATEAAEPVTHWGGFLGLVSPERARTTGYQVLDVDARLAERAALEREAARTPDPAYVAALTGEGADAGDGGCSGWAFDQVTPADPGVDRRIQERLYGEALRRAQQDPAVVRALDGWRACMARRGYDLDAVPAPASTDPVTPELVEQAVADVACKDETDLVTTYVTTLYDAERALAAEHRAELDAFAEWGRERVRLATRALAG